MSKCAHLWSSRVTKAFPFNKEMLNADHAAPECRRKKSPVMGLFYCKGYRSCEEQSCLIEFQNVALKRHHDVTMLINALVESGVHVGAGS